MNAYKLYLLVLSTLLVTVLNACNRHESMISTQTGWYKQTLYLQAINNETTLTNYNIHMIINNNHISGFSGCNHFQGLFKADEQGIVSIGPLSSTRKFCAPSMAMESRVLHALRQTNRITEENGLIHFYFGSQLLLTFKSRKN